MKKESRIQLFGVRTAQMSNEMYNHVMQRMKETPGGTFKDYAYKLIERDMLEKQKEKENKEKDLHVYDMFLSLSDTMKEEFRRLSKKLDQRSFYGEPNPKIESKPSEVEEGLLITEKIKGSIDEEYDLDF
ncbi:hypothetical protein MOB49_11915 [Bacillus haynesii]|uniref:hypothetical protein n=1 Tax=Bacillus TaxID=1386 RepID=UPI001C63F3A5|nr:MULTISPECIES: hypothetical protein [Bacillus]MBW7636388.1 hypothetical protein [Bacillus licheniformis]MCY7967797.1 hypothetical protein [Bacillus haynesii]MCY8102369.1 hypothetical protein [Bacillus haynesii]MCY8665010.1 hypothetical protein [Bacillus haynesii]MEC1348032.1 hypothetical protein [Bacillus haynesii]